MSLAEKLFKIDPATQNGDRVSPFVFESSDVIHTIPANRDLIVKWRKEAGAYIMGSGLIAPDFTDCGIQELEALKTHYETVRRQPNYAFGDRAEVIIGRLRNCINNLKKK